MPPMPYVVSEWTLTGSVGSRRGWFGRMIYQVQEARDRGVATGGTPEWQSKEYRWRDATLDDLLDLKAYGALR